MTGPGFIDAATGAHAVARAHVLLARRTPGGKVAVDPSGIWQMTLPIPLPTMSGMLIPPGMSDPDSLSRVADGFVARGLPWSMSVIGRVPEAVTSLATRMGLKPHRDKTYVLPLTSLCADLASRSVHRRVQSADDAQDWSRTADISFGLPPDTTARLMTPELLAAPEVRAYLAFHAGEPVATALSVLDDQGWLGLFVVGTRPAARRLGIAQHLVEELLLDGRSRGAHTAYLQSTEDGLALYRRLGFCDEQNDTTYFVPDSRTSAPA